jgi:ribonuclease HII
LAPKRRLETEAKRRGYKRIAGVDEAGRGPLAGPVVAAACILPPRAPISGIDNSKKLTRAVRAALHDALTTHPRVSIGFSVVDVEVIDSINILQATLQAMREAYRQLCPDYLLIDGPIHPEPDHPGDTIVKGDDLCLSIAAASIVAKEVRDRLMEEYDRQYPEYGFAKHKGYGTLEHREAIAEHGLCPIHRRSFRTSL